MSKFMFWGHRKTAHNDNNITILSKIVVGISNVLFLLLRNIT